MYIEAVNTDKNWVFSTEFKISKKMKLMYFRLSTNTTVVPNVVFSAQIKLKLCIVSNPATDFILLLGYHIF